MHGAGQGTDLGGGGVMTAKQAHKQQRDRILASLLLADTRAQRHGVYRLRPAKKPHAFVVPVVTERKPL